EDRPGLPADRGVEDRAAAGDGQRAGGPGGVGEGDVLGDVDGAAGLVEGGRLAGRQPHLEAERRGGRRVRLGQGEGAAGDGRRAGRQLQAVQGAAAGQGERPGGRLDQVVRAALERAAEGEAACPGPRDRGGGGQRRRL